MYEMRLVVILGRVLMLCAMVAGLIGCKPDAGNRDPKKRMAAVKDETNQAVLSKIATEDESAEVRAEAVRHLENEPLVLRRMREDRDAIVRNAAAERLVELLTKHGFSKREDELSTEQELEFANLLDDHNAITRVVQQRPAGRSLHSHLREIWILRQLLTAPSIAGRVGKTAVKTESIVNRQNYYQGGYTVKGETVTLTVIGAGGLEIARASWGANFPDRISEGLAEDRDFYISAHLTLEDILCKVVGGFPQDELIRMAMEEYDSTMGLAAIKCISDKAVLAKLAEQARWDDVRAAAAAKLKERNRD